jgi:hypothetical protein
VKKRINSTKSSGTLLEKKKNSLAIRLCDEDSELASESKNIEKNIDLEFKNELECLFSHTATNQVSARPIRNKMSLGRQKHDESSKLTSLFRLIGGHLIKDYSELLVDYDHESKYKKMLPSPVVSSIPLSERSFFSTISFSSDSSFSSLSTDLESFDNTLKLFHYFIRNDNNLENITNESNESSRVHNRKILNVLIKLLAKSCGAFDVATMTNPNGDMSYWRYANPLVALCKRTKNAVSLSCLKKKTDQSIQTSMNYCFENETNQVLKFKNKNINNKKSFQINTNDIEDESMNVNFERDTNKNRNFFNNNNDSVSFIGYVNDLVLVREDKIKSDNNHKFLKTKRMNLEINDILSEVDQNNNRIKRTRKRDKNLNSIGRTNHYSKIKLNARGDSYLKRFLLSSNTTSSTNLTTTSDYLNHNKKNTPTFNFNKNRLDRIMFHLRNANQDETLRDAENISDIENESYIDQWLSNEEQEKSKEKKQKKASSQKVTQKKYNLNLNLNSSFKSNKTNNNNNNDNNTSRSLSLSSSSSNVAAYSIYSNSNSTNTSAVTCTSKYCLVKKYLKNTNKRIVEKNKINIHSRRKMMNCKMQNHHHHEVGEEEEEEPILRRERTHSLDSLEEEENEANTNTKYGMVANINCGKFIFETQDANYDVDVDINVSRIEQRKKGDQEQLECSELSEIPEVKIDFEYKLRSSKTNLALLTQHEKDHLHLVSSSSSTSTSNNSLDSNSVSPKFHELNEETDIVKQRTRESLKFWKQEEQKEKRKDSDSYLAMKQIKINNNNSSSSSSSAKNNSVNNSTKTSSYNISNQVNIIEHSNTPIEHIPIKCVKDRINVFESKNSCKLLTKSSNKQSELPLAAAASVERTEHVKYRQRGKSLEGERLLIQSNVANEQRVSSSPPPPIICTSTLVTNKYLNVSLDNLSPKQIPIKYKDDYLSSNNHFETETPIVEQGMLSKDAIINHLSEDEDESDMEEFEIIIDLSTLKSRRCYPNEKNPQVTEANNEVNESTMPSYFEDTDEEFKQVAESIVNKSFDSFRLAAKDHRNTIDQQNVKLKKSQEDLSASNLNTSDTNQEKLRNIVMYLIPTTRKAYVDDIVDGVKTMLTVNELKKVNSPIDLPENIIKFIQKRYSNLLNDPNESSSSSECSSSNQPVSESVNQEENTIPVIVEAEQPMENFTTTELTVVKEIRSNQSSHISSFSSLTPQDLSPTENGANVDSNIMSGNHAINQISDDILKVEEETLYIVEKRRSKKVNKLNEPSASPHTENLDIDLEIRKNFELKEKPISKKSLAKAPSSTSSTTSYSSSSSSNIQPQEQAVKTTVSTVDCKELNQLDHEYELLRINLLQLIDDLQQSILNFNNYNSYKADGNASMTEINDYQLHCLQEKMVLVMLFDKKNSQNYKYALEKCYHKSIIDTHNLNNRQDVNIVANINVHYIESQFTASDFESTKFETFSLIKTSMGNDMSTHSNLPIGKYFATIKYESVSKTKSTKKESIVDLSLLPIAIRAQLIFECNEFVNKKIEIYKRARSSNTSFKNIELPSIDMLAIDAYLVQIEINKKRDQIIRESLVKTKYDASNLNNSIVTSNFTEMIEFDTFMKTLEVDLNSYYICEKIADLNDSTLNEKSLSPDDLVKLNKLDALASYKCVQKYKQQFVSNENEQKEHFKNSFYLIDNGNHYRCMLPIEDLQSSDDSSVSAVRNPEPEKNAIENIHKRQNFIFSKHLMSAFPSSEENKVKSLKLKQQLENDSGFNDLTNSHEQAEKDTDLPSFSESTNENTFITMKQTHCQQNSRNSGSQSQTIQEDLKKFSNMETLTECDSFKNNDEEFLKSNFKLLDDFAQAKHLRDKVIVKEIDKMFRSIRDHQSASVRAKNDDKKKKNGSWGYSSSKRHVKAKVMELPFAEDLDSLAKRIGINDLNEIDYAFDDKDEAVERVFVRIDDFLNVDISQILQRSYSLDYLNELIGPRTRISDVKIPTNPTFNNPSLLSFEGAHANMNKNGNNQIISTNETSDFRECPYDLSKNLFLIVIFEIK